MRMNKGLKAAIFALAALSGLASSALAVVVPPPPGAPSWWNQTTTPWYSFYQNQNGVVTLSSNEGTGFPISLTKSGTEVTIDMPNGYDVTLYKHFYFYIEGTTSGTADPTFISITGPNDVFPTHPPDSYTTGTFNSDTNVAPNPNTFFVSLYGISVPQPDRILFKFNLPSSNSTITTWWAGEQCQPPTSEVPEPASLAMITVAASAMLARRR